MTVPVIKTVGNTQLSTGDGVIPVSNVQMVDSSVKPEVKRELTLNEIFAILWRRKWIILSTLLLTTLAALLLTLTVKSTYRANATIQIERQGPEVVSFGSTENLSGAVDSLNDPFFRTRYETLKSRKLLTQVIADTNLESSLTGKLDKPGLIAKLKKELLSSLSTKPQLSVPKSVDLLDLMQKRLLIQPIDKTHLVEIYYEGNSPQEAKRVVDSLVSNFIKSQIDSKTETGEFAKDFLTKQVEEAQDRLRESEEKLVAYSNDKGILGIDENQTRHVTKLNELNAALVRAEIAKTSAESKYREMQRSGSAALALSNPVIVSLKARLVELEGQYQEKLKMFKPTWPDMLQLKQQIEDARRKYRTELSEVQGALRADYLAAKVQEQRLRGDLNVFNQKLKTLQNSGVDYNKLKRNVETNARLYKTLLQRVEEVSIASSVNTSNIKIIDPAVLPVKKHRPRPPMNILIGLLSGLFVGLGLAFLREALDQSIRSTEDLQRITGLPVLGLVPKPKRISNKDMPMAAVKKPNIPFSEAYRVLSANVRFTLGRGGGNVILVTSSAPDEGKTTTACNMACSYALMGMKVLLVDADLRKPSIAKKMRIYNKRGLSNFLGGDEDLLSVTQQIKPVGGLYVITSGSHAGDIMQMLSNEKMEYLVSQASQKFDYVIIDSPPVAGFADTLILSSLSSSTLIVADEGKLNISKVRHTLEQLMRIKSNAAGFLVVNSNNSLVTDNFHQKHYHQKTTSIFYDSLTNDLAKRVLPRNKPNKDRKKPTVRGVKKPFWGKPRKGINLGYMR